MDPDQDFADQVLHRDNLPIAVSSTPLKVEEDNKRKYSERDSPSASLPVSLPKCRITSTKMELSTKEKATMKRKGMPEWGYDFFESLTSRIVSSCNDVKSEIKAVETRLQSSIDSKCEETLEKCIDKIAEVKVEQEVVEERVSYLETDIAVMRDLLYEEQLQRAKDNMFSRKLNLLFCGFKENPMETEEHCEKLVRGQLGKMQVEGFPNLKDAKFLNVHRNGTYKPGQKQPRDIIVKFAIEKERNAALKGRQKCDKNIYVNQDLPRLIAGIQRQLKPILKATKGTPYQTKGRVILKGDAILVDNKRFTLETLTQLPKSLKFWINNIRSSDLCLVWHGNLSPFSNFFWAPIVILGVEYKFNEQYINGFKAIFFGDKTTHSKIMACRNPYECKKLGLRVKGFNQAKWDEKAGDVAETCIRAKIEQNEFCRDFLLNNTQDLQLAEASAVSKWGCGFALDNDDVLNPDNWSRIGHAGRVLMDLRAELRAKMNNPPPPPVSVWNQNAVASDDMEMVP